MIFRDSFYKKEIRKGFEISTMMKRCWAAEMEVLQAIIDICHRHGLRYYAEAGTLLGAVREKGFIPWDDDIDITFMRKDYELFLGIAPNELPEGYRIYNTRGEASKEMAVAVANSSSICTDADFLEKNHGFPYPAKVDLFCIDALPDSDEERELYRELIRSVHVLYDQFSGDKMFDDCTEEDKKALIDFEAITGMKFLRDKAIDKQLLSMADYIAAMYCDDDTEYVSIASYFCNQGDEYRFKREWFSRTIEVPYESIFIDIPLGYDDILKVEYGDYMIPVKEGVSLHEYPCYKYMEAMLFDEYKRRGEEIPDRFL